MPGTPLYYVDNSSYEIFDDDVAEGVAIMQNEICAVVDGEVVSLSGPYFLTRKAAQNWIKKNRKPTLWELLDSATWHSEFPAASCKCYIRTKKGAVRPAYFDKAVENDFPAFLSYRGSYRVLDNVDSWTEIPVVETPEW